MGIGDALFRRLSEAHEEALRVGDSPLRADALAGRLGPLARDLQVSEATDEIKARLAHALADAERVLRRDDDGREAAKHLQAAMRLVEERPRRPSPFGDD